MALGLSTGSNGGDFLPIVVYDARAGRLFKVERSQGAAGWQSDRVDITSPAPAFAVDFGSIETGWVAFAPNMGPDFRMAPLGSPTPEKPSKEHKAGFRVKVAGNVLGGVREFSHSAKCVLGAMDLLHSAFEAAPEAAQGKIPVVKLTGTTQVQTTGPQGRTTNYAPVFEIVGWTERLPELGARTVPAPGAKANGNGHATASAHPSNHVPPPTVNVLPPAVVAAVATAVPNAMPF